MIWRLAKKALMILALTILVSVSGLAIVTKIQGGKLLSVQTKSMEPTLKKGELVSVSRVPVQNLKVGDIITFINPKNNKSTITHRIVALPETSTTHRFVTKGDANLAIDEPVEATAIIGKLHYSIPLLGFFADFIRQPLGLALIIYLPALMITVTEMKRLARYYKEQMPYRAPEMQQRLSHGSSSSGKTLLITVSTMASLVLAATGSHAIAQLVSHVTLTGNTISATGGGQGGGGGSNCTGNNNTNVNVNNNSNQTATTGDTTNSNNTNGGSANSGNASNSNNTNININTNNCTP